MTGGSNTFNNAPLFLDVINFFFLLRLIDLFENNFINFLNEFNFLILLTLSIILPQSPFKISSGNVLITSLCKLLTISLIFSDLLTLK